MVFVTVFPVFASDLERGQDVIRDPETGFPIVSEHDYEDPNNNRSGEAGYVSSLHLNYNVDHTGDPREYTNNTFRITFSSAYGMDFSVISTVNLRIRLLKKTGFMQYDQVGEDYAYFTYNYQTVTSYLGTHGSGKYKWNFRAPYESGIDCDTVYLISY